MGIQQFVISIYTTKQSSAILGVVNQCYLLNIGIDGLNVSQSEIESIYRLTIEIEEEEDVVKQLVSLLENQNQIIQVYYNASDEIVWQELALFKVPTDAIAEKINVERLLREFGARAVVIRKDYTVFESTGHHEETKELIHVLKPFGLMEFARSAKIGITKTTIDKSEYLNKIKEKNQNKEEETFKNLEKSGVYLYIYIPQEEVPYHLSEEITNAAGEFMEALGFRLKMKGEPIFSSFWNKLLFVFKKHVTAEEIDIVFNKGKRALELKNLDGPTAELTEKLALAAQHLINSLDKYEEGVIRCGALLVLKKLVNGKSRIFPLQLNQDLIKLFDEKPQLLFNLQTVYEIVTGDVTKNMDNSITEAKAVDE